MERMGVLRMFANIARHRPDCLLIASREIFELPFLIFKALMGAPVVSLFHYVMRHSSWVAQRSLPLNARVRERISEALTVDLSDSIVVLSQRERNILSNWYRTEGKDVHVIGNGIDPDECASETTNKSDAGGPLQILALCPVSRPEKGLQYLLAEMESVKHECELYVVGTGPGVAHSQLSRCVKMNLIPSTSRASFLSMLRKADVFVSPSMYEPFSLAALEAMACGAVVIASEETGMSILIEHGINGFIVPHGKRGAVAGVIDALAQDRRLLREAGLCARAAASERSWDKVSCEYYDLLLSVVRRAKGSQGAEG
jgi:glycosyltransferase involved in cell wall biosynthesis